MPNFDVVADLRLRGLIHQTTDDAGLGPWLLQRSRTVYAGFDPTADSLHVGHLMALMILRRFQKAGHRPIALIGGATGMIGDPSGKSEERKLLSEERLRHNVRCVEQQLRRFLDFQGLANAALLLNNYDWMGRFGYLEFLREVGKHFPVNVMLTKDSIRRRLEQSDAGLSYTEFSYMLLQAYDFVHLFREYECELQVGGSDQWGNITAGIDLARRLHSVQLHGLTCPLLTKSDGGKMGKTESGALWLDPAKTSPYRFYQYWINVEDELVEKCLKYFTDLSVEEIDGVVSRHLAAPEQRLGQRTLAAELTRLVHGAEGLEAAERATEVLFGAPIERISPQELNEIFADVPSSTAARGLLEGEGMTLIDALCAAGLAKNKSDARRVIQQGGAYVNNVRVEDLNARLTARHLVGDAAVVLRAGKKRYALLRFDS
ncbi:MAG: tyrosine--tRNA ligase [Thermogutta sp.]|nr:tyrosine--tRNA ligase [Thermogutta sp.]